MMDNILKKLREEAEMTQEAVAEKLEVSVNTIQNWERNEKIAKEQLHRLLDLYQVDQMKRNKVVLLIFGNNGAVDNDDRVDNFPYFLFEKRPDIINAAKGAVLSHEEMELFGYSYYISKINESNHDYSNGPRRWPMEYSVFERNGGYFKTLKMISSIEKKIGNYMDSSSKKPSLAWIVDQYGLNNTNNTFNYCELNKKDIAYTINDLPNLKENKVDIRNLYAYCKCVETPIALGTNTKSYIDRHDSKYKNLIEIIDDGRWYGNIEYKLKLVGIKALCFVIEKIELVDNEYLKRKEQYLSDIKAFDKHPGLYDREPRFEFKFEYYLKLSDLGKKYIEWYES